MSQNPLPYTNLSGYPIATVVGITGPYYAFGNAEILPLLRASPLKLKSRNETFISTPSPPQANKVLVRAGSVSNDGAPDYGPWVPGVTGATGATYVTATTYNMITKNFRVQNNSGTTGGNMVPNYNNPYITLQGITGTVGSLFNIVPYGELDVKDNNIFIETNCIPFDNIYGRFPLKSNITGAGRTGVAYTYPSEGGWTGPYYVNPYSGATGQNSNVYDQNNNYITVINLQYDIPRYPQIKSDGTPLAWGAIGYSFRNTPIFTALSEDGWDAVSIVSLDQGFQHTQSLSILHTHSTHPFIYDQNGNWEISTQIKVIGYMIDGFPVVAPFLLYTGSSYRVVENSDLDECHGMAKKITFTIDGVTLSYNYFYVGTLEFPYFISALRGYQNTDGVIDNSDYFGGTYRGSINDLPYPSLEMYDEVYQNIVINPGRVLKIRPSTTAGYTWDNFEIYSINNKDPTAYAGLISINANTGLVTLNNLTRPGVYYILVTATKTNNPNSGSTFKYLLGVSVNR